MRTVAKIGTMGLLLLLIVANLVLMPQALAKPQYATALQSAYGSDLCTDCHTDPNGGKSLNDYGTKFKAQPNYKSDPASALQAIGAPPGTTSATPTITATVVSTPEVTTTETQVATPTVVETSQPIITDTKENDKDGKEEENSEKEETSEKSPGFGIFVTIGMISAIYMLRGYKTGR